MILKYKTIEYFPVGHKFWNVYLNF